MRPNPILATAVAVVLLAASRANADAPLVGQTGAELFQRFCASCHGEQGHGDGPVARGLNVAVPDLSMLTQRYGEFPASRLRDTIDGRGLVAAHGTRTMPVWGYLLWVDSGQDVAAQAAAREAIAKLVEHVRSLQRASSDR